MEEIQIGLIMIWVVVILSSFTKERSNKYNIIMGLFGLLFLTIELIKQIIRL